MFVYSTDAIDVLRIARLGHIYEKKCWFPAPKEPTKFRPTQTKILWFLKKIICIMYIVVLNLFFLFWKQTICWLYKKDIKPNT